MSNHNVFEGGSSKPESVTLEDHMMGVKITVEIDYEEFPGFTPEENRRECERRAQLVVDHFKLIMGRM